MRLILISFLFCLGVSAQLPEDRPPWLNGRPLLEDTFATPLAAGSVNGTYSTGRAPGLRTVTDFTSSISVTSSNTLYLNTSDGSWSNGIIYSVSLPRTPGRFGIASINETAASPGCMIGWSTNSPHQNTSAIFQFKSSGIFDGTYGFKISDINNNQTYRTACVLRLVGAFYLLKGSQYSQWTLQYPLQLSSDSPINYGCWLNSSESVALSSVLIPKTLWLPSPIASDSFTRANGALGVTDGNGTQEQNGGAGLTWNAPGWVVSGNTASNGMATPSNPVTSGLVGYWKLDEGTGTSAADSGSGGNTGTLNGGSTWISGIKSNALIFNGSTGFVDVGDHAAFQFDRGDSFTISAWINTGSGVNYPPIFTKGQSGGSNTGYWFRLFSTTGNVSVQFYCAGAHIGRKSGRTLLDSKWHHVLFTYDGSSSSSGILLYIDGVNDTGSDDSSGIFNATMLFAVSARIGGTSVGASFPGAIDDVRIYSRAITPGEVNQIYLAGNTAIVTNLTANVLAETSFTSPTNTCGLVLNYDGSTGTNLITSYFDGNGNVKVDQIVNGNATNLISGAVTYVANARLLTVSAPSEGQVRVYYNNSFVNSSTGIWPGFTNFTQHGLYSQGSGSFTNYANFARGTEGQYSIIDKLP